MASASHFAWLAPALVALAGCRRPAPSPAARRPAPVDAAPAPVDAAPATEAAVRDPGRAVLGSLDLSPDGAALLATAVLERSPESHAALCVELPAAAMRWSVPMRAPRTGGGVDTAQVARSVRWSRDGASVIAHWPAVGALGVADARDGSLRARHDVLPFGQTVAFSEGALFGDPLGAQVRRLPALHEGPRLTPAPAAMYFAAVSDDGTRAALPGDDGLAVYDLASGARVAVVHGETASTRISLSRNGSRVAEVRGGALRVWSSGARAALRYTADAVDTPHVALSPDGARVAVCGDLRGGLVVHDLASRRVARTDPDLRCQGIDWSPDGAFVAAAHYDGVTLLRVTDGARLTYTVAHRDGAWRVGCEATPAQRADFFAPR